MVSKPVIFSVDDDSDVLNAITRDLRRRYGKDYRIMQAQSGQDALNSLRELQVRNDPVALLLVDQRMPQMNGVEFLSQAMPLYPQARRALLTAYADTEAAIQAINQVTVHHYLLKPWEPPDEKLYPVLDDLLDDWRAGYRPPFEGLHLIGHRWSPEAHTLRDFLARNQVPYQYYDIEMRAETQELIDRYQLSDTNLPVVILEDGTVLHQPSAAVVAERLGLKRQAERPFYDLVIVGGGPAGLAAAVYGASEGLSTVMIEREATGGQAGTSSRIENYLGFPSGLSGGDLARRATAQAKRFGVEILAPQEAVSMRVDGLYRILQLADGSEIACQSLVLAMGLSYRKLHAPGVDSLTGAGVYYGASLTEATACTDQPVFIIGSGNSAGQAALYLSGFANKVVILVRGDSLATKMSQYLVDRIENPNNNIELRLCSEVAAAHGDDHLEALTIRNVATGEERTEPANGLFIFIGAAPQTDWLDGSIIRDQHGFVLAGPQLIQLSDYRKFWPLERDPFLLETSLPGVFVVGDVRAGSVKRVASAVGEGSIAVQFVHQHLSTLR
jgi:thioredoxin reductase (NADPH)